ncbi:MAG: hypothetical protein GY906_17270 [bacterium]|nr:hypothetical protein [bacterium]
MKRWQRNSVFLRTVLAGLCLAALGCASQRAAGKGEDAVAHRNWDAAVYYYLEALASDPDNVQFRMELTRARQKAAQDHFRRGNALIDLGQVIAARDELRMAVQLDPTHQFAAQVLEDLRAEIAILSQPGGADTLKEMKERARELKVKPPVLDPKSNEEITLNFPKAKPLKEIYRAIGKAYGFNALFDPKLKDNKLSIELTEVTAEQALELVMQAAGHFYKVFDSGTIIIVEDTPQNRREYEDLVIKTFFLSNADVKDVDKLLRSLIEARRLATNEQLNSITLRDTADKVAIAEKLIEISDKAKAELLVDVELLLIASSNTSNLGATLSTYSYTLGLDTAAVNPDAPAGFLGLDDFKNITRSNWFINVPSVIINLVKTSGEAEVLAQPQLRVTEGEKAQLHIGDKVPIPVTSFNTGNSIGGNVVPITSFQYQDIGIKIDVEPRVHHNREVTMNLTVEVSNLGEEVSVGPQQSAVTIGTRTITTVIRLQDGETSLLAGLFRNDKTVGIVKTPLLSDIPLLGRLFTNKAETVKRTDLVLTLTPHIVRFPDIQEEDLAPVWVGTESRISFHGASPRVQSGAGRRGPFDAQPIRRQPRDNRRQQPTATPPREEPQRQESRGEELVPRPSGRAISGQSFPSEGVDLLDANEVADTAALNATVPTAEQDIERGRTMPIQIRLDPGIVTIEPGEVVEVDLVSIAADGVQMLPLGISFDPDRIEIEAIEPTDALTLLDHKLEPTRGWLQLEAWIARPGALPQVLATLRMRGIGSGPSGLILSSGGAHLEDGHTAGVATSDGAVVVLDEKRTVEPLR